MEYTSNSIYTKNLKPLEVIPHRFHSIFQEYPHFNFVQSSVIDDIIYGDDSIVVSAPTGSGKTAIFELAIVRTLITYENTKLENMFKIIYIAPMKALCEERLVDWHKKFSGFGLNCISVTGDSENVEFKNLFNHNVIITTPEKWDCLTRKWRDNRKLMKVIKLFLIDEIHLLNEESRGPTLEAIICRMKTIQSCMKYGEESDINYKIRFIGVSATIPNIEDIAEWIGKSQVKFFKFSEEARPVKLKKIVLGYNFTNNSYFKFDIGLSYKLSNLIEQYSERKPTLIFCSTRKIVEMTTAHLLQNFTVKISQEHKNRLAEVGGSLSDDKVKNALIHGIGMHHAGMLPDTRQIVETTFRNGELPILVATSTLAMGINLPAHLVIIKSTKCYRKNEFRDYSDTELTQMIGRAGRPQYDTSATVLILTTIKDKAKFERMVGGSDPVESNLHKHLIEHINAEVVLQTITDMDVAMRWLSSTFLYIRAKKNPRHYGLSTGLNSNQLDRKLLEMCQIELNKLINAGMLTINPDVVLEASPTGVLMARYYLSFQTMKLFTEISGDEILQQILHIISQCHEFSEIYLRVDDKKYLNLLNKCKNKETIRFPLNGKIKTLNMKIDCLIQAAFGCLDVTDHSLMAETLKIVRHGERISKCLIEYLETRGKKCYQAILNTITLAKCFTCQLWENSPHILKQLKGIGVAISTQFVKAGKTTIEIILESDPRELEMIMNRKPPAGSKILDQIKALPKYSMRMERFSDRKIKLEISLDNVEDIQKGPTLAKSSLMYLLVGDSDNNIMLYEKYSHTQFINSSSLVKYLEITSENIQNVRAHFISENWVGFDCHSEVKLFEKDDENDREAEKSKKSQHTPKIKSSKEKKRTNNGSKEYLKVFLEQYEKLKPTKSEKSKNQPIGPTRIERADEENLDKIDILENIEIRPPPRNWPIETGKSLEERDEIEPEVENLDYSDYVGQDEMAYINKLFGYDDEPNSGGKDTKGPNQNSTSSYVDHDEIESEDVFLSKTNSVDDGKSSGLELDFQKFRYAPRKKSRNNESSAPSEKKAKISDHPPSQEKKITWSSPLLANSPLVKFSPKISLNKSTTHECSSQDISTPTSNNTNESSKTINKPTTYFRAYQRIPRSSARPFPLADKHFISHETTPDAVEHNQNITKSSYFQQKPSPIKPLTLEDVCSDRLLDQFGLLTKTDKTINTTQKSSRGISRKSTVADYYTDMMTRLERTNRRHDGIESPQRSSKDSIIQTHNGTVPVPEKFNSNVSYEEFSRGVVNATPNPCTYRHDSDPNSAGICNERQDLFAHETSFNAVEENSFDNSKIVEKLPTENEHETMTYEHSHPRTSVQRTDYDLPWDRSEIDPPNQQSNAMMHDRLFMEHIPPAKEDYDVGYEYLQMVNQQRVPMMHSPFRAEEPFYRQPYERVVRSQHPNYRTHGHGRFHESPRDSLSSSGFGSCSYQNPNVRGNELVGRRTFDLPIEERPERRFMSVSHNQNRYPSDGYDFGHGRYFGNHPPYPPQPVRHQFLRYPYHDNLHGYYDGRLTDEISNRLPLTRISHSQPVHFGANRYHYCDEGEEVSSSREPTPTHRDFLMSKFFRSMENEDFPH